MQDFEAAGLCTVPLPEPLCTVISTVSASCHRTQAINRRLSLFPESLAIPPQIALHVTPATRRLRLTVAFRTVPWLAVVTCCQDRQAKSTCRLPYQAAPIGLI